MKKVLKLRKKYVVFIAILLLVVSGGLFLSKTGYFKEAKIKRILASEDYAYLPVEAKNYIRKIYDRTGSIILTEKNKEEN